MPVRDTIYLTFTSSATLPAYTRVKVDANGELVAAGIADQAIGFLTERGATAVQPTTVRVANAPEHCGRANDAIAVGAAVYSAASGRIDDVATSAIFLGYATTAAAAQDGLIRFVSGV
jgi:hypothetical protein